MPDSLRIKEIHAALEAQTYSKYISTDDGEEKARVANLGYWIKRIANVLGLTALADGTTYKPKEPRLIAANDQDSETNETIIPAPFRFSHWGQGSQEITQEQLATGVDSDGEAEFEETDAPLEDDYQGMVYSFVSNKFITDPSSGENTAIIPSGYALCRNFPQMIRQIMDDMDKGLGLQESAAFAIRSVEDVETDEGGTFSDPDYTPKVTTYEGLHSIITEIAFMTSEISRRASGAQVASLITQACVYELMAVQGLPVSPKSFKASVGLEDTSEEGGGQDVLSDIYHPGFSPNAPTHFELWTMLMHNIAPLLGQVYNLDEEQREKIKGLTIEELEEYIQNIKDQFE